jgi:hypothetical protein
MAQDNPCSVVESSVMKARIEKVWELLRPFDFKFMGELVHDMKLVGDTTLAQQVGGEYAVQYKNGDTETIRIAVMDDKKFHMVYNTIDATPPMLSNEGHRQSWPEQKHTIQLLPVTDSTDACFLQFSTDYSRDIPLKDFVQSKVRKHTFFAKLRKMLMAQDGSSSWQCANCTLINERKDRKCTACEKTNFDLFYEIHTLPMNYPIAAQENKFEVKFQLLGHTATLLVFPRGNNPAASPQCLSAFLAIDVPPKKRLPIDFFIKVLHPTEVALPSDRHELSAVMECTFTFLHNGDDQGFSQLLSLTRLARDNFLDQNSELKLQVGGCLH